jgi:hypothetical protein
MSRGADRSAAGRGRLITAAAAAVVLLLAVGALFWPGDADREGENLFLVFDGSREAGRLDEVYEPLALYLEELTARPLDIVVCTGREDFTARAARGAGYVLCPDGLAIGLDAALYDPVAVGRRSAPRNLRPRGVLVYRKSAGLVPEPWVTRPDRTVFGDSLTLAATGAWRRTGRPAARPPADPASCAWGPDPYDHAPALHAVRLGAFDYAVVRQWDADRFFTAGLLSALEWGVEPLTVPVPDVVLLAGPPAAGARLEVGDRLAALGRRTDGQSPAAIRLQAALGRLGLVGFNLLVEPDFDLVRRNFAGNWLPATD